MYGWSCQAGWTGGAGGSGVPGYTDSRARRARQGAGRQVSGHRVSIQAQQHGRRNFPVVSVMSPASPAPGSPGQGALVLQHAPPPPGPQPESPTSPQTGTMALRTGPGTLTASRDTNQARPSPR